MYNSQLSRREFLRGTAKRAVAVTTISSYDKAVAAAGGLAGILAGFSSPTLASSHELSGLKELREYAKKVYKEVEEYNTAMQREYGKKVAEELKKHREKRDVKVLKFDQPHHREPDLFDDYIDGRRVQVRVRSIGIDVNGNNLYDLETRIFDPSNRRVGMPYDNRFDINDNERFLDKGIKGNLLDPKDFVHIKTGDGKNWESAIWSGPGGYQLKHWKTLRKEEVCKSPDSYTDLGVCLDGTAIFSSGREGEVYTHIAPELNGYYKTTTHSKLQERHKEAFRKANEKYQRLLQIVINKLI